MQLETGTKIWLEFGADKFLLPVNPSSIDINNSAPQDTFNILGSKQVGVPQYPDLRVVKFKSFFPGNPAEPFVNDEAQDVATYCQLLEEALNNAEIGRIVINRPSGWNLDMQCVIKSFKTTDEGGEPEDVYYQIELSEYVPYQPETLVVSVKKQSINVKKERTNKKTLRVGAKVVANGTYCYDSYGSKPHGTAKNLKTEVKRIVKGREYPILIGVYGWIKESSLQIKG